MKNSFPGNEYPCCVVCCDLVDVNYSGIAMTGQQKELYATLNSKVRYNELNDLVDAM